MNARVFGMNIHIPGLHVIFGPTCSGKTETVITLAQRCERARWSTQIFKYKEDGLEGKLKDRQGRVLPAQDVVSTEELLSILKPVDVYFLDGVHFLDYPIIDVMVLLAKKGKAVVCTFPESNFRGEPLLLRYNAESDLEILSDRSVVELIVAAEYILPLAAVCTVEKEDGEACQGLAIRTQKLIDGKPAHYSTPQFLRGDNITHEPRCIYHHEVPGKPKPNL